MKKEEGNIISKISILLLVFLVVFTLLSSQFLKERKVVNTRAFGDNDNTAEPVTGGVWDNYVPDTSMNPVSVDDGGNYGTPTNETVKVDDGGNYGTPTTTTDTTGKLPDSTGKLPDSTGVQSKTPTSSTTTNPLSSIGNQLLQQGLSSLLRGLSSSGSSSSGTSSTTSTSTSTTSTSVTATPTINVGATSIEELGISVKVTLKLKFQGINKKPKDELNSLKVKLSLVHDGYDNPIVAYGTFTADDSGIWTGTATFANVIPADGYTMLVKGPKHIQKKICTMHPTESSLGVYKCIDDSYFPIDLVNNLDFSGITLLAGDLPDQDSVVNSYDFSKIKNNIGKKDLKSINTGDLNLDGTVNSLDYSLITQSLLLSEGSDEK